MAAGQNTADVLVASPFRLFFLLAGALAAIWIPYWVLVMTEGRAIASNLGAIGWHAHEMVFGYTGAVLAGFLLTAARVWTKRPTVDGMPMLALVILWAGGRVIALRSAGLPPMLPAIVDGAFWLGVAAGTARAVVGARSTRNYVFPALLLVLGGADVIVHLHAANRVSPMWSARALPVALDALALVIFVFGGRIIPLFTGNAIAQVTPRPKGLLDWVGLGALAILLVAHAAARPQSFTHWLAIAAGALNAARLWGWGGSQTLRAPILWALHLGWLLLGAGVAAQGIAGLWPRTLPPSAATHLFTVGGLGLITLAMMARVSLGHTGRRLVVPASVAIGFGLVVIAAAVRVLVPTLWPARYLDALRYSGIAWALGFAAFTLRYAPILMRPRVDGKPG